MAKLAIGVDLGGTKIATCLMDKGGRIVKKLSVPPSQRKVPMR